MKRVLIFLLLAFILITPAFAVTQYVVADGEDMLSDREEQLLSDKINDLSEEYEIDIFIVTVANFGGKSVEDYAEDCWEQLSSGEDGILFLFSMTKRQYDIYYTAGCAKIFDNKALDRLEDAVVSELKKGNANGAANAFIETSEGILEDDAKEKASWAWKTPLICLGVGAVVSLIAVLIMAGQHKNVHRKYQAGDYVRPGSFHLTRCLDLYLYQTTTRRRRPQNNGSGGSSRGGGGHRSGSF